MVAGPLLSATPDPSVLEVADIGGLADVERGIDAMAAENLMTLSREVLQERVLLEEHLLARLQAQHARTVRVFDERRAFEGTGSPSTAAWLQAKAHVSGAVSAETVAVARDLAVIGGAAEAFEAGEITASHAAAIARHVRSMGPELAARSADILVRTARTDRPEAVLTLSRNLRIAGDPEGALRDYESLRRRRFLRLAQCADGMVSVDGMLDPETGAKVRTALDSLSRPVAHDSRSASQRCHDALGEVCERVMSRALVPTKHGIRPHLTMIVPLGSSDGQVRVVMGGQLSRGGVVPPETVERHHCDSSVRRVIVNEKGEIMEVTEDRRLVPPALRAQIVLLDEHCAFPDCREPEEWCEVHHLLQWSIHRQTRKEILTLLCRFHHHECHEGGWLIDRRSDGSMLAVGPAGQRLEGPPRIQWAMPTSVAAGA